MKNALTLVLALTCLVVFSSPALAGPDCEKACAKACDAKVASACAAKSGCDISKKLNLAKITYRVGDFQTACRTTADNVAKKTGESRSFMVAGKTYKDEGEAVAALTAALEKQAAHMQTVRFVVGKDCLSCPNAAASLAKSQGKDAKIMYRVAGHEFACDKKAAQVADAAKKAARTVAMQYKVGEKCIGCPNAAASLAKSSGKKIEYQIGAKTTACNVEAKLLMAQAKIQAIYNAAETPAPAIKVAEKKS